MSPARESRDSWSDEGQHSVLENPRAFLRTRGSFIRRYEVPSEVTIPVFMGLDSELIHWKPFDCYRCGHSGSMMMVRVGGVHNREAGASAYTYCTVLGNDTSKQTCHPKCEHLHPLCYYKGILFKELDEARITTGASYHCKCILNGEVVLFCFTWHFV